MRWSRVLGGRLANEKQQARERAPRSRTQVGWRTHRAEAEARTGLRIEGAFVQQASRPFPSGGSESEYICADLSCERIRIPKNQKQQKPKPHLIVRRILFSLSVQTFSRYPSHEPHYVSHSTHFYITYKLNSTNN